jgi:hypothetical protein
LRNALDDFDGSVIEDAAELFGHFGIGSLKFIRRVANGN